MERIADGGLINSDPGKDPLLGTVFDGTYEIISRIGKGGMGSVYKAYHRHLDRFVAMKVLRLQASQNQHEVQRFRQEARALHLLSHPNIVSCYAFGIHEDHCYLVMDLIEGTTLREDVETHGPLSADRFRQIFRQVLSALRHAHENGIVHRDLKPDNIMLVSEGSDTDVVKIVDFGIAKVEQFATGGQQITRTGAFVGSPLYMSPEQCKGQLLDARSDIYSLGCLMYFSVSGRPPFDEESTVVNVIRKHLLEEADELPLSVEAPISDLIVTAMSKKPQDRFASVADMSVSLDATTSVKSPRRLARRMGKNRISVARFVKNNAKLILGTAAVTLMVAAGVVYHLRNQSAADDLQQTVIEEQRRYLVAKNKTESSLTPNQRSHDEPLLQHQLDALTPQLEQLVRSRIKRAEWFLDNNGTSQVTEIAEQVRDDIKAFFDVTNEFPVLQVDTIASIDNLGKRLLEADEKRGAAMFTLLALSGYQRNLPTAPTQNELVTMLDGLDASAKRLLAVQADSAPIRVPGVVKGNELRTPQQCYTFALQIAFRHGQRPHVVRFANEAVNSLAQDQGSESPSIRRDQSRRLIRTGTALINCFRDHQALPLFERAAKITPCDSPEPDALATTAAYYLAYIHFRQDKNMDQAKYWLDKAIACIQRNFRSLRTTEMHLLYADICLKQKDRAGALAHLRAALANQPDLFAPPELFGPGPDEAHFRLAELMVRTDANGEARKHFDAFASDQRRLLEAGGTSIPGYLESLTRIGARIFAMRNYDLSRHYYEFVKSEAVRLDNQFYEANAFVGLSAIAAQTGGSQAAIEYATRAIKAGKHSSVPLVHQGGYYIVRASHESNLGNFAGCLRDTDEGLTLLAHCDPNIPATIPHQVNGYYFRGVACAGLNRFPEAEAAFRTTIIRCGNRKELLPRKEQAVKELYYVLVKANRKAEAEQLARDNKLQHH